jgi:hypothetical protein
VAQTGSIIDGSVAETPKRSIKTGKMVDAVSSSAELQPVATHRKSPEIVSDY